MQQHDSAELAPQAGVLVQHRVLGFSDRWLIGEPVPEAAWHDHAVELMRALLEHWRARGQRDVAVFRNLAIRVFREKPRVGFDPDVMVVDPAPSDARDLSSLRVWEPGHAIPALVIEVVSPGHPFKDYVETPDQCAALGVAELVVFDPLLVGPKAHGGPQRIQVWQRSDAGTFARVASGEGPFRSAYLDAYLIAGEAGRTLRIADDAEGRSPWLTAEEAAHQLLGEERARKEAERTEKEAERTEKEAERTEKERALARIAELEEELRKRG